jgi:adenosylcobinamide-GDP ribazoletransferase
MSPVLLAAALPYARADAGTGAALTGSGRARALLAALIALALAAGLAGADGAVLWACGIAVAALAYVWLRRWLGGVTGDALGAVLEVSETAALVLAVALVGAR